MPQKACMSILIQKATVIWPGNPCHLKKNDILVTDGLIARIGPNLRAKEARVISGKNLYVSAGWTDLFADFAEPGNEQRETLESGQRAAAAGGYTDVALIPNLKPITNGKSQVEYLRSRSVAVNLHPIGCISKDIEGKDLAEMYDMTLAGAVAFSDGLKPVQHSGLMMKALQYVRSFDGVLIQIPDDRSISRLGLMHEGEVSTRLGLMGKPAMAESILLARDLELLQYTGSRLHVTGISTRESLDQIRKAKKAGMRVTCSVSPYHLLFTDEQLGGYDSLYKVYPPLRSEADRKALVKGIADGTIDAIASHHMPRDWDDKEKEFEYAAEGMITLQTMLPMLREALSALPVEQWIPLLTDAPRNILGLSRPELEPGAPACLTVFDPEASWTWTEANNHSRSANSPLMGQTLKGKVVAVVHHHHLSLHE